MMGKLVTQRAEKRSKGSDLLADGGSHPDANHFRVGMVIAEQLRGLSTFAGGDRPGREDPDGRSFDFVIAGKDLQKLGAGNS
jgi:hypothetical protein